MVRIHFTQFALSTLPCLALSRTGKVADPTIDFLFSLFYSQILHHTFLKKKR